MRIGGPAALLALAALGVAGCGSGQQAGPTATVPPPGAPASTTTAAVSPLIPPPTAPLPTAPLPTAPTPTAPPDPPAEPVVVEVPYRVERRTSDAATADFTAVVESTLSDPRGWSRAGFRMVRRDAAAFLIVLAEGPEVDRLCLPYDTYGLYSCQNGPVVALNADRWRVGTPEWTGDLASYRQMLANHEVGHLLGQRHPPRQCPRRGRPAPIMAQQSTELNGCLPNPWPLPDEIEAAARHDEPLAPPFRR